jgi:tetratricopeptide (TPR) repeat protein
MAVAYEVLDADGGTLAIAGEYHIRVDVLRWPVHENHRRAGPALWREVALIGGRRRDDEPINAVGQEVRDKGTLARRILIHAARQDDDAANAYRRTLEMDSTFGPANYLLAMLYSRTRQFDSTGRVLTRMSRVNRESDLTELRGYTYAMQGDSAAALRVVAELKSLAAERYVSPHSVALIYAALGDRAHAMQWLQKAYTEHASEMYALKVDPVLDPLRSDPRFAELLRRMRLD